MSNSENFNDHLLIKKKNRKKLNDYLEGIDNFDINTISQVITLVESHNENDYELAQLILENCLNKKSNSKKIGITGIPGVGKSTFIETFGMNLIDKGHSVAVLAIDPSSDLSGGSILGDKTRMQKLSLSNMAFIRPSPAKGILGGVAQKTNEAITICEAAGFDYIIIETVGVGQSEAIVSNMVDFFLMLTLANTGDDLQGIKRGILEQANGIVFTKNDGDNVKITEHAVIELKQSLNFIPINVSDWKTPVTKVSSYDNSGFDSVDKMLEDYYKIVIQNGFLKKKRADQRVYWFKSSIDYFLNTFYMSHPKMKESYDKFISEIKSNKTTPTGAAKKFIDQLMSQ